MFRRNSYKVKGALLILYYIWQSMYLFNFPKFFLYVIPKHITRYKNKQDINNEHNDCIKTADTQLDTEHRLGMDAYLDKLGEIFWALVQKTRYGLGSR